MLLLDAEGALETIPSMLPDDPQTRRKGFELITQVLRSRGEHSTEDRKRILRVGQLFGVDDQLKVVRNVAIAPEHLEEKPSRAS